MKKLKCLFLAIVLWSPTIFAANSPADQAEWYVKFFQREAISLSIDSEGAHFITRHDGRKFCLGKPSPDNMHFVFDFTLKKTGDIFFSPEHHGSMVFTVKKISSDNLILKYESYSNVMGQTTKEQGEFTLSPFVNQ